jgi:hypothetical protein
MGVLLIFGAPRARPDHPIGRHGGTEIPAVQRSPRRSSLAPRPNSYWASLFRVRRVHFLGGVTLEMYNELRHQAPVSGRMRARAAVRLSIEALVKAPYLSF